MEGKTEREDASESLTETDVDESPQAPASSPVGGRGGKEASSGWTQQACSTTVRIRGKIDRYWPLSISVVSTPQRLTALQIET